MSAVEHTVVDVAYGHERRPCNRRLPVNFRYAPLATEVVWQRNMSLRAKKRTGPESYGLHSGFGEHIVSGHGQPDALDGELTH